jgi:hypothetical protein
MMGTMGRTLLAHEPLVHEAPRMSEGAVSGLHPRVGHVELELVRERLHQVPAETGVHGEGPVRSRRRTSPQ